MNATATKAYLSADVNTARGGQLILRLYDKAICCLSLGEEAILKDDPAAKAKHLTRVLDIIHELMVSVNFEYQPIATSLFNLYSYLSHQVLAGCVHGDVGALREVTLILKDLRGAWGEAVRGAPLELARPGEPVQADRGSAETGAA